MTCAHDERGALRCSPKLDKSSVNNRKRAGPLERSVSDLPAARHSPHSLSPLRHREARRPRLARRQPVLHPAVSTSAGAARTETIKDLATELALDWNTVKELDKQYSSHAPVRRDRGDRHRRAVDPQGTHLPHRGQRFGTASADLVRRRESLRSEHGRVLPIYRGKEGPQDPPGRHGHVEAASPLDHPQRTPGRHPVRQVPTSDATSATPSTRSARPSTRGSTASRAPSSRGRGTRCCRIRRTSRVPPART